MHPVSPELDKLPIAEIYSCVELYENFSLQPMHRVSLCIRKILQECLIKMLADPQWMFSGFRDNQKKGAQINRISKSVLQGINIFLTAFEYLSPGFGHVDFLKAQLGLFFDRRCFRKRYHRYV